MIKKFLFVLICSGFLLTGCEDLLVKSLLPEEIVEAAIDTNAEIEDYYIESSMKIYNKGVLLEESTIKEWNAKIDGEVKRRTEVYSEEGGNLISTIEDEMLIMYSEKENQVYNLGNIMDANYNLAKSLRDKTKSELDTINEMYNMETVGEEDINGVKTYHIKGKPKKESVLLGDYEMWIDKENWVVMKMLVNSGDTGVVTENIKVELSPEMDPAIFTQDIPEDAEEISFDSEGENESARIEEAYEHLNKNLLIVKDEKFKLENIEVITLDPEKETKQFTFKYTKNGAQSFDLIVMKVPEEGMADIGDFGFQEIEIRENPAFIIDDIIKMINFEEDENYYMFLVYDEDMPMDDMIELIEGMEQYKQNK